MVREGPDKQVKAGRKTRDENGRFAKGASGNPRGRHPKGFASIEKLRIALADELPAILRSVVRRALDGDIGAAKLILERVLPALKPIEAPVAIQAINGTLTEQGEAVLRAMASGVLSPGQAAQILGAIGTQAKLIEIDELEKRLVKLEQSLEDNNVTP